MNETKGKTEKTEKAEKTLKLNVEQILCEETRERIRSEIIRSDQDYKKNSLSAWKPSKERPVLTVDALVYNQTNKTLLLVKRKNPPHGWALPGGLMDVGETVEDAVKRELKEETNLIANSVKFFRIMSDPERDPRFHAVSIVYYIESFSGTAKAADDAKDVGWFGYDDIRGLAIAFDHRNIIDSFFHKMALQRYGINTF